MFVIIRSVNGAFETLKDSNTSTDKTFSDFSAAQQLVQVLNQNTNTSMQWSVKKR